MKERLVKVTRHQRALLEILSQHERMTVGELAALLGITSVAATKNIHRLEHINLVIRVVDEQDHRRTLVVLTTTGRRIVEDAH